jgi:predicted nucleotidyltransferase
VAVAEALERLTVFGSATRDAASARDLDIAFLSRHRSRPALLELLEELVALSGTELVDLMVLDDAEPAARFNGLVGALPLYEDEPGRWAQTQMAAAGEVFDTEWLRRSELERMAGA